MYFRTLFSREISIIKKRPSFYITLIALLSAVSVMMMYVLHFPVLPGFPMLQLDFADVSIAIAAILLGPLSAVIIALVKCLLYLPVDIGRTAGIGVLSNFICAVVFGLTIALVYHLRTLFPKENTTKRDILFLILAFIAAVIVEASVAMASNWFIILPLYVSAGYIPAAARTAQFIFAGTLPFNLIKFSINAFIGFLLAKALLGILPKIMKDFTPEDKDKTDEVSH